MKLIKRFYGLYCFLGVFIHEVSHLLMATILLSRPCGFSVSYSKEDGSFGMSSYSPARNLFSQVLISYAPLFMMMAFIAISAFHPYVWILTTYYASTTCFFPSRMDITMFSTYKMYKEIGMTSYVSYLRSISEDKSADRFTDIFTKNVVFKVGKVIL